MAEKIILTRMLIHNWAGFSREIMCFRGVNQIIGENGSGKSTFIDAFNLLWSGTKTLNEASGNSGSRRVRTLATAIHGVNLDTGNVLRPRKTKAFVVMEFYNQKSFSYFLNGVQMVSLGYSGKDTSVSEKYFSFVNARLEDILDYVYSDSDRFEALTGKYPTTFAVHPTKKDAFESFFKQRGFRRESYRTFAKKVNRILMAKMTDESGGKIGVNEFAKKYILPDGSQDIGEKIKAFRDTYDAAQQLSSQMADEMEQIKNYEKLEKVGRQYIENNNFLRYLRATDEVFAIDRCRKKIGEYHDGIEKNRAELDETAKRISELEAEASLLAGEEAEIKDLLRDSTLKEKKELYALNERLALLHRQEAEYNEIVGVFKKLAGYGISCETPDSKDSMEALHDRLDRMAEEKSREAALIRSRIEETGKELSELRAQLSKMRSGVSVHIPAPAIAFADAYRQKSGKPAHLLYEMVESIDPEWQQAIEMYLGNRRYALLVGNDGLLDALRMQKEFKGTVIAKIREPQHPVVRNAFDVVKVKDSDRLATEYLEGLLKGVKLCETEEELKLSTVGIMKDGRMSNSTMYENRDTKNLTLVCGKEALKKQIEDTGWEIMELEAEKKEMERKESSLNRERKELKQIDERISRSIDLLNYHVAEEIAEAEEQRVSLVSAISETEEGERCLALNRKLEEIGTRINTLNTERNERYKFSGSLEGRNAELRRGLEESKGQLDQSLRNLEAAGVEEDAVRDFIGSNGITEENTRKLTEERLAARGNMEKKAEDISRACRLKDRAFVFLLGKDDECEKLEKLIRKKKEVDYAGAQKDLDSFLETAKKQKNEVFVGVKDSYVNALRLARDLTRRLEKVKIKGDRIIIDVREAEGEAGSYLRDILRVYEKSHDADLPESEREAAEKRLDGLFGRIRQGDSNFLKYADYKYYIDVNVIMEHEEKGNRTRKPMEKYFSYASGGQEQTPLYMLLAISLLSVFKEDGARLIILDEAFSKMDAGRTKSVIEFFKELNLQMIISTYDKQGTDEIEMTYLMARQDGKHMHAIPIEWNGNGKAVEAEASEEDIASRVA